MKRVSIWLRKWGWSVWASACMSVAGWHFYDWQFYVALIPLAVLVALSRDQAAEEGLWDKR